MMPMMLAVNISYSELKILCLTSFLKTMTLVPSNSFVMTYAQEIYLLRKIL